MFGRFNNNIARIVTFTADEKADYCRCGLHRAFFWGHMHVAALLLEAGAQLHLPDDQVLICISVYWSCAPRKYLRGGFEKCTVQTTPEDCMQGRSPLDILSVEQQRHLTGAPEGEVYTWGNGSNYQLGSGGVGLQLAPVRLEALREVSIQTVSAAKFHSAAISSGGQLYTWGFGRGGRLGQSPKRFLHLRVSSWLSMRSNKSSWPELRKCKTQLLPAAAISPAVK